MGNHQKVLSKGKTWSDLRFLKPHSGYCVANRLGGAAGKMSKLTDCNRSEGNNSLRQSGSSEGGNKV